MGKLIWNGIRLSLIFILFSAIVFLTTDIVLGLSLSQLSIMDSYSVLVHKIFGVEVATAPIDVMKIIAKSGVLWVASLYSGLFMAIYERDQ